MIITDIKTVVIESPFKASATTSEFEHVEYARRCLADSLARGEAPFASHLLYTQVLDDADPQERDQGIKAGIALGMRLECRAFYSDYGFSDGMKAALRVALDSGQNCVIRKIGRNGQWSC